MKKRIILLFFVFSSPVFARFSTGFGTSFWTYGQNATMQFEPTWSGSFAKDKSRLDIEIGIPVFVSIVTDTSTVPNQWKSFKFFLPGYSFSDYNNEAWPEKLSSPFYGFTYLRKVDWEEENFHLKISEEFDSLKADSSNIISNPFYDSNTGILNRYGSIDFFKGRLRSSSLTSPGLFYLDYSFYPFEKGSNELLRVMSFLPLVWADIKNFNSPGYGGGLVVEGPNLGKAPFMIRFKADSHFYHLPGSAEDLSFRLDAVSEFLFRYIGFSLGYIFKSQSHPFGPLLAGVYPERTDYSLNSRQHGILAGLIPGFQEGFGFSLFTEIYPENTARYSLRAQLDYKWKKNSVSLGYEYEGLENYSEFLNQKKNNVYASLNLNIFLIPERLKIRFCEFLGEKSHKSILSLYAYF